MAGSLAAGSGGSGGGARRRRRRKAPIADINMTPKALIAIEGRKLPVSWDIAIASLRLAIECVPLNTRSWMGTSFPYWEGPISFGGSHAGLGYLEMTGY